MKRNKFATKFKFGSKAETLAKIENHARSFNIPHFVYYSYASWQENPTLISEDIFKKFQSQHIAVRSSAVCEDGNSRSYAGAFKSFLDVIPVEKNDLIQTINLVFASYPMPNKNDQVLIQEMVQNITVSGVILTRCVDDGSPYYVLNYDDETGRSDSVTGGSGIHKTVMVYRDFRPKYCDSSRVRKMVDLAKEIEEICGWSPLDIEFAMDANGLMHLLQVRRITTASGWHPDAEHRVARIIPHTERFVESLSARKKGLYGDNTIFGNMPDWNPAELIGVVPSPLAASLFRLLISGHAWSEARARMGYRRLPRTELMVLIGGRAFIDVRASFNSFLPVNIPDSIGEKLINAWLNRLVQNPNLHDKVEFEVAYTALDFAFENNFSHRYRDVLDLSEEQVFKELLRGLTIQALDLTPNGSLTKALHQIDNLASRQLTEVEVIDTNSPAALAACISGLLEDCLQDGTIPFSILARHAFIAESLLRSSIDRAAISAERISDFKTSFKTIMGELAADTLAVSRAEVDENQFFDRYGHLRPGTFDIMSPCYRNRTDLFTNCQHTKSKQGLEPFILTEEEENNINQLLQDVGLVIVDAQGLFEYAKQAIQGREYAKFVFTRNLSEALEGIGTWGEFFNMGREDLAHLSIKDIIDTCYASTSTEVSSVLMQKVDQARIDQSLAKVFKLSYLVRGVRDIYVVPIHRSEPNFITRKQVESDCIFLQAATLNYSALKGHIICIDNADPGFDWIFTKGIAGLITKYGGANSHMAIRCAELQLPAAIGCGEELFERLRKYRKIDLNCSTKIIRPLDFYV